MPGGEAAGVIDAVGEGVEGWHVGDRVMATVGKGAFADHILAVPQQLLRLPDEIDLAVGASFMQVYGTAWFAFKKRTVVRPGEVVLVTGAGGGVGLGRDRRRSRVRRPGHRGRVVGREAGARHGDGRRVDDRSAHRGRQDPRRELTDGAGVDLVYDVAGGDVSEPALRALRFDGRFLVIGFPGGIAKVPLNLVLLNNRTVIGVEWGGWVPRNMDENRAMIGDIVDAIARGELHPVKPTERPLTDARAVLSELLDRQAAGKIVLVP